MGNRPYLGTGMKFPPQINPATGRIVTASEIASVKESIYLILMTSKTERLTRPDFGSRINAYTFMDIGITQTNILQRELREMILTQEPRVSDVDINIEDQTRQGRLIINIDYEISATHQRDSMVFPYYLEREDEVTKEDEFSDYDLENTEYEESDTD